MKRIKFLSLFNRSVFLIASPFFKGKTALAVWPWPCDDRTHRFPGKEGMNKTGPENTFFNG